MTEAHVRIDEGIKRGPRKPRKPRQATTATPQPHDQGKLANLDVKNILERYIAGETSTQIAASLGVTRQGLAWWMRKHAEEDWKEAQIVQAVELKERAQEEIGNATDALSLACAREKLRGAQWDLERVFHRIFGQKQEVKIDVDMRVQVSAQLAGKASDLLDRIRGVASQHERQVIDMPSDAVRQIDKPKP